MRGASRLDAGVGDHLAVRVGDKRGAATEKASRPDRRSLGEILSSRGEDEQVLDRGAKLVLLAHAPDPAEKGRRCKADIDGRHDRKDEKLHHDGRRGTLQGAPAEDAHERDRDQDRKAKAEETHPGPLHRGKVPAGEPEAEDRLASEDRPCADELEADQRRDPRVGAR